MLINLMIWGYMSKRALLSTADCTIYFPSQTFDGAMVRCSAKVQKSSFLTVKIALWGRQDVRAFDIKFQIAVKLFDQFTQQSVDCYIKHISDNNAPLDRCMGLIVCTKIKMQRPEGSHSSQRCVYSIHRPIYCLTNQTITASEGLIFVLYGSEESWRHDLPLL